jgi:hypothetical protein
MYWDSECNCAPTDSPVLCALVGTPIKFGWCKTHESFQLKTTWQKLSQHLCNARSTSASLEQTQLHTCLYPQGNSHVSTDPSLNLAELQYSFTVYLPEVVMVYNTSCHKLTSTMCSCDNYTCCCLWFSCTEEPVGE